MSGAWWGPTSAKGQFLRRLHKRVGHPFPLSLDPSFRFDADGERWKNLSQLEALVEFYANFPEPWGTNEPRKPGDAGYVTINFREPRGRSATVRPGNIVHLDGDPDLRDVIPNPANNLPLPGAPGSAPNYPQRLTYLYDTLWLGADRTRPSRTYRILGVDNNEKTVTLDAEPDFNGDESNWRLNRRPIIVIVDPFGPRVRRTTNADGLPIRTVTLSGARATVVRTVDIPDPTDPNLTIPGTTLQLDGTQAAQPLIRINPNFDTIYLSTDTEISADRPGAAYRIVAVDQNAREITVIGRPDLEGGSSPWEIPAGVSGVPPHLQYRLVAPPPALRQSRGFDHYDGVLFIVYRGRIAGRRLYRWSSFTSRDYGPWPTPVLAPWPNLPPPNAWQQALSSIRGNAQYCYSSYRSGSAFRNYALAVVDIVRGPNSGRHGLVPAPPHEIHAPGGAARDRVAEARFYFGTPSPPAAAALGADLDQRVWADDAVAPPPPTAGKARIRLHQGNVTGTAQIPCSGSAGCLVSPQYTEMRTELVQLFEEEFREYYGPDPALPAGAPPPSDAEVHKLIEHAQTIAGSMNLYNGTLPAPNAGVTLAQADWDDKLVGTLWLIRPDERPVSGP
jgi:hypothetical protein